MSGTLSNSVYVSGSEGSVIVPTEKDVDVADDFAQNLRRFVLKLATAGVTKVTKSAPYFASVILFVPPCAAEAVVEVPHHAYPSKLAIHPFGTSSIDVDSKPSVNDSSGI